MNAVTALAVTSLVWIGMLFGVSFLATPVKFLAPSLSLPVALDVGRQTFAWFSRIEVLLAVAAFASAAATEARARAVARIRGAGGAPAPRVSIVLLLTVLLAAAVALQVLWLLPVLDARVEVILGGGTPPPSSLHTAYVGIEAVKLGMLIGVAWIAMTRIRSDA